MTLSRLVRVVIVEDNRNMRAAIQTLVERQEGFIVVGACSTLEQARILLSTTAPDLLLLDIVLPDGTAFDLLEQADMSNGRVIFLTSYQEYALKAIKYSALDYLLKPVDPLEWKVAIAKVTKAMPPSRDQLTLAQQQYRAGNTHLVFPYQQTLQIVQREEIVYGQSNAGYTTFYLADGSKVITSKYLKELEPVLPEPPFIRPHKSYIVNNRYIKEYNRDGFLLLMNQHQVPVATRRREDILQHLRGQY